MNVTVVGAGPGGLVAALAMRRRGIDVEILEQAPPSAPRGSARWPWHQNWK